MPNIMTVRFNGPFRKNIDIWNLVMKIEPDHPVFTQVKSYRVRNGIRRLANDPRSGFAGMIRIGSVLDQLM